MSSFVVFLGFIISTEEIKMDLEKVKAILQKVHQKFQQHYHSDHKVSEEG